MKDFGVTENKARRALISTKNASVEAVFEYLESHPNEPGDLIDISEDPKKKKRKPRLIPLELQNLFTRMQCVDQATLSTEGVYFFSVYKRV